VAWGFARSVVVVLVDVVVGEAGWVVVGEEDWVVVDWVVVGDVELVEVVAVVAGGAVPHDARTAESAMTRPPSRRRRRVVSCEALVTDCNRLRRPPIV
jgi:hypothetical protein